MNELDIEVKIFLALWIMMIALITCVLIWQMTHPQIILNYVVNPGNYSIDLGTNFIELINKTKN